MRGGDVLTFSRINRPTELMDGSSKPTCSTSQKTFNHRLDGQSSSSSMTILLMPLPMPVPVPVPVPVLGSSKPTCSISQKTFNHRLDGQSLFSVMAVPAMPPSSFYPLFSLALHLFPHFIPSFLSSSPSMTISLLPLLLILSSRSQSFPTLFCSKPPFPHFILFFFFISIFPSSPSSLSLLIFYPYSSLSSRLRSSSFYPLSYSLSSFLSFFCSPRILNPHSTSSSLLLSSSSSPSSSSSRRLCPFFLVNTHRRTS